MADEQIELIVVTVDDKYLAEIQSVVTSLQSSGMIVNNVMTTAGIIIGEISQTKISELKKHPGVIDVEKDLEMRAN
ncbi:MAG: hypothetical protein ACFBSE_14740 [Prochloraceae cyanobacterium]